MTNTKKPTIFILLLTTIILLTACHGENNRTNETSGDTIRQMQCIEQQSQCYFDVADGRVEILFDVDKIIAEQAFNISVNYIGTSSINTVSGYMEGVDMFMGKIPLFLEKKIESDKIPNLQTQTNTELMDPHSGQVFLGEMLVGSCSAEKMVWRVWLTFTTEDKQSYNQMLTIVSHRS
jgi:hypothetical protein